jgi:hypothetical protein
MSGVFKKDIWREGNISRVRDGWDEIKAEETRLLRRMTVEESLEHFITLQRAFEPQLRQTESLFRAERLAYLEELQRRLLILDKWMKEQCEKPV